VRAKIVGKNRMEKLRKNVFYIHTIIVTQKGGKKVRNKFSKKHTNCACKKCSEKKRPDNGQKRLLYSHGYRDQRMGGKNARNNLSLNTRILRQKLLG